MKMPSKIERFEKWELHHKIVAFVTTMVSTVILTRLAVMIHDPSPVFMQFEIHHFDYGILLLFITCLLLLFSKPNLPAYMFMAAVSFGLIIDELWFIRNNVSTTPATELQIYNSTYLSVVILTISVIFLVLLADHFKKKKKARGI